MQQLTEEDITGVSYIKPSLVHIYIKGYKKPIEYMLDKDKIFKPLRFYEKNGKSDLPFWRNSGFIYDIYENQSIRKLLHRLDSNDLWTEKDEKTHIYTYIRPKLSTNDSQKNTGKPAKPVRNNTRSSIYNKNGNKLPLGWHRISKNGKNSFKGPENNQIYKNVTRHNKNRTYKVKEGNDTFYILPDGTLSWTPFKVPAA
jgi:hypothetical protein